MELLMPNIDSQGKPAEGIAEACCVGLMRGQVDRQRAGLLRFWADVPSEARFQKIPHRGLRNLLITNALKKRTQFKANFGILDRAKLRKISYLLEV
jgi:hypothetical protein